jgi:TonB family protein
LDLATVAVAGGTRLACAEQRRRQQRSLGVSLGVQVGLMALLVAALELAPPLLPASEPVTTAAQTHQFAFLDVPLPLPAPAARRAIPAPTVSARTIAPRPIIAPSRLVPNSQPRPTLMFPPTPDAPMVLAAAAPALIVAPAAVALPAPAVASPPAEASVESVHLNSFTNQGTAVAVPIAPGAPDGVRATHGAAAPVVALGAFDASPNSAKRASDSFVGSDGLNSSSGAGFTPGAFGGVGGKASAGAVEPGASPPSSIHLDQFRRAAPVATPRNDDGAGPLPAFTPPQITYLPQPHYPAAARAAHREGDVVLRVRLGAAGTINVVGVVASLGDLLDAAAIRAAQQLQFHPARRNGQPVDWAVLVRIHFRLAD